MARKFIPDADADFASMARNFAEHVSNDAAKFGLSQDEGQAIAHAVAMFFEARNANANGFTRSKATSQAKDEARALAEKLIRRAGNMIRGNDKVSSVDKIGVGVKDRPTRLRKRACPEAPPTLHFGGASSFTFGTPGMHVIHFFDAAVSGTIAKPDGAARLELFVDLVPPGEPIPEHPGQRHGGMTWYLRSYTRSPMRVEYPKSETPMRVVYWGRWASATGETGAFSRPLVAPIEGRDWSRLVLPAPAGADGQQGRIEQKVIITSARRELPDCVETIDTLRAESSRSLPARLPDAA